MFDSAFGWSIRKSGNAMIFQCDTFYFHKCFAVTVFNIKIKPGASESDFTADDSICREQISVRKPFRSGKIGGLRIHVDQSSVFIYGYQIVFGFAGEIIRFLNKYFGAWYQQFPAASGIFDMADFSNSFSGI